MKDLLSIGFLIYLFGSRVMKGWTAMDDEKRHENAVLIYFLVLIVFVISNMLKEVTILDVIYLIALVSAVVKFLLIQREKRK